MSSELVLWHQSQKGDRDAQAILASNHVGLVYHVSSQMCRRIKRRPRVEITELISPGTLGLIRAVETFDPDRGTAFSTHAVPRIRGAILDDLRRKGVLSLSHLRNDRIFARQSGRYTEPTALTAIEKAETAALIASALSCLPVKQRQVLYACFWEGKRGREIAREMGCAESNVSALRRRGLERLREFLPSFVSWPLM
jgi:RNA polymerase sigma factor (sigma-70 family)